MKLSVLVLTFFLSGCVTDSGAPPRPVQDFSIETLCNAGGNSSNHYQCTKVGFTYDYSQK